MKHVREWGPGDYRNAGAIILALVVIGGGVLSAYRHPPEANPRLQRLESSVTAIESHEAHDDTLALYSLCRESETALDVPERVAVARCLEKYPTLLDVAELSTSFREIQVQAEQDTIR